MLTPDELASANALVLLKHYHPVKPRLAPTAPTALGKTAPTAPTARPTFYATMWQNSLVDTIKQFSTHQDAWISSTDPTRRGEPSRQCYTCYTLKPINDFSVGMQTCKACRNEAARSQRRIIKQQAEQACKQRLRKVVDWLKKHSCNICGRLEELGMFGFCDVCQRNFDSSSPTSEEPIVEIDEAELGIISLAELAASKRGIGALTPTATLSLSRSKIQKKPFVKLVSRSLSKTKSSEYRGELQGRQFAGDGPGLQKLKWEVPKVYKTDRNTSPRTRKINRCLKCEPCLRDPCGVCRECLDAPRFGGPGIRKRACLLKMCVCLAIPT